MLFRLPKLNKGPALSRSEGFTLLEMMVVIFIITLMTGVLMGNLPDFRDSTTLQLVSQEVAVTFRQAQVFGIGTKASGSSFPGHGIYLCSPSDDACKKNFLLFVDNQDPSTRKGDKFFGNSGDFPPAVGVNQAETNKAWIDTCESVGVASASGECADVYSLGGNIEICAIATVDNEVSTPSDDYVSIAFSRLYPDASIADDASGDFKDAAEIYMRSSRRKEQGRKVQIGSPLFKNGDN